MIILAVDPGERRAGFAICDEEERVAVPAGAAQVQSDADMLAAVLAKADQTGAQRIVVGHPVNMNGKPGPKARAAEDFCSRLVELGRDAVLWDERLTTAEAGRALQAAGASRKQRMRVIDANAAQRLLSAYIDNRARAR